MSQVAYLAGAYLGFSGMKRLGVYLPPPPVWDASPSQGYPPSIKFRHPFILYTPGWREAL